MDEGEKRKFHTLDGIRGVAALAIVVLHTPHFFGGWHLESSFLAVDLFFVLSGFVLAFSYERRFEAGMTTASFLLIRLVRLYPLYLLGTLIGVPVALLSMRFSGLSVEWNAFMFTLAIPFSLAFLPTPRVGVSDVIYPFNPVLWSIAFEVVANVLYVAAWPMLRRTPALAAIVAVSALGVLLYGVTQEQLDAGFSWDSAGGGAIRVCFSFFTGVLLFRVLGKTTGRVSPVAWLCLAAVALILGLPNHYALHILAILVLIPLVIALASVVEPGARVVALFTSLGLLSYPIYAVHKPVYQLCLGFLKVASPIPVETLTPWLGIMFVLVLLPACLLIDRVYDRPARRWLAAMTSVGSPRREATLPG